MIDFGVMKIEEHKPDELTKICNEVIEKVNGSPEDLMTIAALLIGYAEMDVAMALYDEEQRLIKGNVD